MFHRILITGSAGFIGYHLSLKLIELGFNIVGVDNLNSYYDINLKNARLSRLKEAASKHKDILADFIKVDLVNRKKLEAF